MVQSLNSPQDIKLEITPFKQKLNKPFNKQQISVLQINLGKRCNLACTHCHVEAGPKRTEELSPEITQQLVELIKGFPQIKTVDLTGGAPEMNYGFQELVKAARDTNKEVIVRSNLTIFFEAGFEYLPKYFAQNKLRIVASLPCYLEDNVDKQRGSGVYNASIRAIQILNHLGYGSNPDLIIDLVYNPSLPTDSNFSLTPNQQKLQQDYKTFLQKNFDIKFNNLFTITNIPIGRTKDYLKRRKIYNSYLKFLEENFNPHTVDNLMCRNELSIDYLGNVYDCDFNQMENLPVTMENGEKLTLTHLLTLDNLDIIKEIKTGSYCYGCTAGSGSSCGGALI